MRLTLKNINAELAKRGDTASIAKAASGHFYLESGQAADWLDRTVNIPTVNSLILAEWMAEFERLKQVNAAIMGDKGAKPASKKQLKVGK